MRDRPAPVRYDDVVHAVIAEVVAAAERLVRVQQGFVGETLGATIDDREDGTLAATALARTPAPASSAPTRSAAPAFHPSVRRLPV